jgi:NADH-ubiquinone oxidoreductase chain 2
LLLSSFLSLIIGAILGLTQFRVKRLYAYSTISHLGFILLALSINSVESIESFIFYLMQYSITNLNAFIILIAIGYKLYLYMPNSIALASQSENKKMKRFANQRLLELKMKDYSKKKMRK